MSSEIAQIDTEAEDSGDRIKPVVEEMIPEIVILNAVTGAMALIVGMTVAGSIGSLRSNVAEEQKHLIPTVDAVLEDLRHDAKETAETCLTILEAEIAAKAELREFEKAVKAAGGTVLNLEDDA